MVMPEGLRAWEGLQEWEGPAAGELLLPNIPMDEEDAAVTAEVRDHEAGGCEEHEATDLAEPAVLKSTESSWEGNEGVVEQPTKRRRVGVMPIMPAGSIDFASPLAVVAPTPTYMTSVFREPKLQLPLHCCRPEDAIAAMQGFLLYCGMPESYTVGRDCFVIALERQHTLQAIPFMTWRVITLPRLVALCTCSPRAPGEVHQAAMELATTQVMRNSSCPLHTLCGCHVPCRWPAQAEYEAVLYAWLKGGFGTGYCEAAVARLAAAQDGVVLHHNAELGVWQGNSMLPWSEDEASGDEASGDEGGEASGDGDEGGEASGDEANGDGDEGGEASGDRGSAFMSKRQFCGEHEITYSLEDFTVAAMGGCAWYRLKLVPDAATILTLLRMYKQNSSANCSEPAFETCE